MSLTPSIRVPSVARALGRGAAVVVVAAMPFLQASAAHAETYRTHLPESDDPTYQVRSAHQTEASSQAAPVAMAFQSVVPAVEEVKSPLTGAAGPDERATLQAEAPKPLEPTSSAQQAAVVDKRALPPVFVPVWPVRGEITTYFGEVGPTSPRGHSGLDIADDEGTPIHAADDGTVLKAYWSDDGYGGLVIIDHPAGFETWYAHLSKLGVKPGQTIKRGEQIGLMGSTGYSTGPHLHFEVREDGQLLDPLAYLPKQSNTL
jgi:murein DD-endopeptidase MepM/ murein hydrolase activator NlpD